MEDREHLGGICKAAPPLTLVTCLRWDARRRAGPYPAPSPVPGVDHHRGQLPHGLYVPARERHRLHEVGRQDTIGRSAAAVFLSQAVLLDPEEAVLLDLEEAVLQSVVSSSYVPSGSSAARLGISYSRRFMRSSRLKIARLLSCYHRKRSMSTRGSAINEPRKDNGHQYAHASIYFHIRAPQPTSITALHFARGFDAWQ